MLLSCSSQIFVHSYYVTAGIHCYNVYLAQIQQLLQCIPCADPTTTTMYTLCRSNNYYNVYLVQIQNYYNVYLVQIQRAVVLIWDRTQCSMPHRLLEVDVAPQPLICHSVETGCSGVHGGASQQQEIYLM